MEILYPERNVETDSNLRHIASHAIEGDSSNLFCQGNDSISFNVITSGNAISEPITFNRPYSKTPRVFVGVTGVQNQNGWVTAFATNVTNKGFTLVANSFSAQSLTVNWVAIGQ